MSMEIVQTKYGKLRGVLQQAPFQDQVVFKGVPYAQPPVGGLRFAPPVPLQPWQGILDCTREAPAAWQIFLNAQPYESDFFFGGYPDCSEDCLYMDITTGAREAGEKRPVYVWFHGGGLNAGYSYEPEFDGNVLAQKGVIVVSVAQRLNVVGYLALPQLTAERGKSGNYGLMDEGMALRWIVENIGAFGGDPEQITVGGQSGGSLKAGILASSPVTARLVRRCIAESGLKIGQKFLTQQEAEQQGIEFLKSCGIDPSISLEELRQLPTEAFRAKGQKDSYSAPGQLVWDGEWVPCLTMRECLERYAGDVDFLCGTNLGEADVTAGTSFAGKGKIRTKEEFDSLFREILGDRYEDFPALAQGEEKSLWKTARELASMGLCKTGRTNFSRNLMVDRVFGMQRKERGAKGRVYAYLFTRVLPCRREDSGPDRDPERVMVYHSSELFYVFASLRDGVPPVRPWQPEDFDLAEKLSSYWANFIKTGNPNGNDLPDWPQAGDDYGWMRLDVCLKGEKGLNSTLEKRTEEFVRGEYFAGPSHGK